MARLLVAVLALFLTDSLFEWAHLPGANADSLIQGRGMWGGIGVLAGLVALAWLALEAMRALGRLAPLLDLHKADVYGAGLGLVFAVLTAVEFAQVTSVSVFGASAGNLLDRTACAWIGLLLALAACALALARVVRARAAAQTPPAA